MSKERFKEGSEQKAANLLRTPLAISRIDTLASSILNLQTGGEGFVDITGEIRAFAAEAGALSGLVTLYVRHTSASLTIQENADPDVLRDLVTALRRLAPADGGWRHTTEGPDDMPAHIKTMLTATSLQIPVIDRELMLGTWQAVYLVEHRAQPHKRQVVLQFVGEASA
jgi:secondary thiamine-phosphate synthase enzyme